ncbi:MAG: hypothetical protein E7325_00995 [Clostridiales bacterium]|nr:hypothetical protein [Clostridiales bacterium]
MNDFRFVLQLKDATEAALLRNALKQYASADYVQQGDLLARIDALASYADAQERACQLRKNFEELTGYDPDEL